MTAYYNEVDVNAAAWLRELIKLGVIADGVVDTRSITEIKPEDLVGYTQCHFFAGIGVWSYALRQAGWSDDRPVWTGSCPCQPFSAAYSHKNKKFDDQRHLWPHFQWLIEQCKPSVVMGEQVASLDGLGWIDLVRDDLSNIDYVTASLEFCGASIGAPHNRPRMYWAAYPQHEHDQRITNGSLPFSTKSKNGEKVLTWGMKPLGDSWMNADQVYCRDEKWRYIESGSVPLTDISTPDRAIQIKGYGNAIIAPQAAFFASCVKNIVDVAPYHQSAKNNGSMMHVSAHDAVEQELAHKYNYDETRANKMNNDASATIARMLSNFMNNHASSIYNYKWKLSDTPSNNHLISLTATANKESPVKGWPTPSHRDHKGGYKGGRIRNGKLSTDALDVTAQISFWSGDDINKTQRIMSPEKTLIGLEAGLNVNGELNPHLPRWLMGLPIEWTIAAINSVKNKK